MMYRGLALTLVACALGLFVLKPAPGEKSTVRSQGGDVRHSRSLDRSNRLSIQAGRAEALPTKSRLRMEGDADRADAVTALPVGGASGITSQAGDEPNHSLLSTDQSAITGLMSAAQETTDSADDRQAMRERHRFHTLTSPSLAATGTFTESE